ncbi:uncharacterized protein SAPINGB_P002812 [Magnusiomyces paraingens]|uniref:Uncharacterized protein n=1 Tax=Magnusiomyces paraingens TaxID=2606893 RepID=A0A5E8BP83_9ASCO|nr:uncharacterized protein SAPINGB_P002812 [Saprochaete ingens]VVT50583.1 unnamed protein product [Saprochaete ingens]
MAQRKYLSLPDIDQNPTDVYETPDSTFPDIDNPEIYFPSNRRRSIDNTHISTDSATQFFSTKILDPEGSVDFRNERSDILVKSKYNSYQVHETLEARIARLLHEVNDVQKEVLSSSKVTRLEKFGDDKKKLSELEAILKKIQLNNFISDQQLTERADETSTLSLQIQTSLQHLEKINNEASTTHESQKSSVLISKITELENRILTLERAIGIDEMNLENDLYRPILTSLQEIRQRLKLITSSPASLEASANNLTVLIQSIKEIRDLKDKSYLHESTSKSLHNVNRKQTGTTLPNPSDTLNGNETYVSSDQQIRELYSKISIIQKLEIVIPKVLLRLNSLRDLHTDALIANESIKDFDSVVLALKNDIYSWKQAMDQIQNNLDKFSSSSIKNRSEILGWISELKQISDEKL